MRNNSRNMKPLKVAPAGIISLTVNEPNERLATKKYKNCKMKCTHESTLIGNPGRSHLRPEHTENKLNRFF